MASRKRKPANLLDNRTASVSLTRNGLTIAVDGVGASDSARVAKALLDAMRDLTAAGYDELLVEATPLHSGALGEVPEEAEWEEARAQDRRVGFHTA